MQLKVVQLERHFPDGVVMTAHWTATKSDGDYTASAYGSIGLPAKDPSDPTFVAYEDITEAQYQAWLESQPQPEEQPQ